MVEVDLTYDLSPKFDMVSYGEWAHSSAEIIKRQPGVVAFRGHRQVFGTPRICSTSVWRTTDDWNRFSNSTAWLLMRAELNNFAADLTVNLRGSEPPPKSSTRT